MRAAAPITTENQTRISDFLQPSSEGTTKRTAVKFFSDAARIIISYLSPSCLFSRQQYCIMYSAISSSDVKSILLLRACHMIDFKSSDRFKIKNQDVGSRVRSLRFICYVRGFCSRSIDEEIVR